jgi:hypothetical protein
MITEESIRKACNHLAEILIAKNTDYGNSVEEQFKEYGETSLTIRLDDKLRRLKQLQKASANVKTESKADTLLDAAGYSILGYLCVSSREINEDLLTDPNYIRETFNRPKKSPFEQQYPKYFDQDDQH